MSTFRHVLSVAAMLLLACNSIMAQTKNKYNLNFEELNGKTGLPYGWGLGNIVNSAIPNDASLEAYSADSEIKENGKYSLLIDWTKGNKEWTASNYVIHKIFAGDKIKLTGFIKTENVTGGAGLWMRLDGENHKNFGFDNMQDRAITGTTDWQEYTIELDYDPDQVKSIVVGGLISGKGKMWMDDLHVTIDGMDIADAPIYTETSSNNTKYITDDSLMITIRDGAQVSATMVRRRSVAEPQPVVLMFDIYPDASNTKLAKYCAEHGYVGIIADTRGKRLSKEAIEPFEHDANDVYDVIDWISKQPWCNGKVGMYGGSYLGFSQWAAAKKVHPALKTIVPQVAVGPGIDFPAHLGVNMCYSLRWLHYVMNNKLTDLKEFANAKKWDKVAERWYTSGKAFNSLDTIEGRPNKIFHRWLEHPSYDAYWSNVVPYKNEFAHIKIPVLTISGYYDGDQRGALYYFNQHQTYNANNNDYLLIGPYDHVGAQAHPERNLLGYTIDSAAHINIKELVFQWFDYVMKDSATPSLLKDKINFEVMGDNTWRHVSSFAEMNNDTLTFYLSNIRAGMGYKLLSKPGAGNETIRQEIDLADRSDSSDKNDRNIVKDKLIDDSATGMLNYLTFISDPLSEAVSVNGSFTASLNTIINKKDMDLVIDLWEQLPNGKYQMLSNNIARCSFIKDRGKRQLLEPGKKETILFDNTFFTSRKLSKGSRVVLLMGINKNKGYEVNYGTGNDVSTETIKDAADPLTVQWLTGNSCIKLPVMK